MNIKKSVCLLLTAALVLSGCALGNDRNEDTQNNDVTAPVEEPVKQDLANLDLTAYDGSFGTYTCIKDPTTGVPIMDTIVPYGWSVQAETNWNFVSTNNPVVASIQFTSPDGKTSVLIQTGQDFLQSSDTSGLFPHQDYIDYETYITHLAYKNAGQVLDMIFNGTLGTNGTMIKETPITTEIQSLLDQTASTYLTTLVDGINQIAGGYGIGAQASGYEGTAAFRRYRFVGSDNQSYVADAFTCCIAAEYITASYGTNFVYVPWTIPVVMMCIAQDETTLDAYGSQYEIICENMLIRNEFNYVKSAYGNQIRNTAMKQQTNAIAAMTEEQAQSYLNDYDDSYYTSDDWANDWSDFIYDRNEYTTTDGETIKVGTEIDAVYQNGDEFYFGTQGSAPFGWEQLNPN